MAMTGIFITGTDTDVGKTHVTCHLAVELQSLGYTVGIYKPVCSGARRDAENELYWDDLERIAGVLPPGTAQEWICPQRFCAPLAPPEAAKLEGRTVNSDLLRRGIQSWNNHVDVLLVEGVGGWLSPIAKKETGANLAIDLGFPVLIVAANKLGMVNHTLLTIESVENSQLSVSGIIVNSTESQHDESATSNAALLSEMTRNSVFGPLPWISQHEQSRPTEYTNLFRDVISKMQLTRCN
ncbi:dethiobiotin synthase [Planctomicrobium sp. SH527]|uniref:dethiobiotin synthase n=1 Tax=Planctomicrobium sp. SH527 TaxID=3448123 RepID=UPI003F5C4FA6